MTQADQTAPIIEVSGLEKSFGPKHVLRGIDLNVAKGESIVVIGGSGSGKSVLLKNILGLMHPDKGSIKINGVETARLRGREREAQYRHFGMLFQGGALLDSLKVFDNVALPLREHTQLSETDIAGEVRRRLAAVGLSDVDDLLPGKLSGGMSRRAALARA